MKSIFAAIAVVGAAACNAGAAHDRAAHQSEDSDTTARLDPGLGVHRRSISTRAQRAQDFFNQGLRLEYAFNHEGAIRSYREALRADSTCAMCWWGIALASGPNINAPLTEEGGRQALNAVNEARRLANTVTPIEREMIEALSTRHTGKPGASRVGLDSAFALAMGELAGRHGGDADVLTLYAAALMNLSPWNYWEGEYRRRTPKAGTARIIETLERAIAVQPDNPGPCHYYIHAVEAAAPDKALPCAERLGALMPGAGHIVHMPGHIYIRVGRYADAVKVNDHAVHADESRIGGQDQTGLYAGAYYPHNYHFMAFAATMAGMEQKALDAARTVAPRVPFSVARDVYWIQNAVVLPHLTLLTFGRWEDVLREPLPAEELADAGILARYAQGVALAALGRPDRARELLGDIERRAKTLGGDPATKPIPHIAPRVLAGEIALRSGDHAGAVNHFQAAASMEDQLLYDEPPLWYYPVRHSLGRALLEAGRPADAERVYRQDLDRFPENGWSLFGLAQSLEAQGRSAEAEQERRRFRAAWSAADVELTSSRF